MKFKDEPIDSGIRQLDVKTVEAEGIPVQRTAAFKVCPVVHRGFRTFNRNAKVPVPRGQQQRLPRLHHVAPLINARAEAAAFHHNDHAGAQCPVRVKPMPGARKLARRYKAHRKPNHHFLRHVYPSSLYRLHHNIHPLRLQA